MSEPRRFLSTIKTEQIAPYRWRLLDTFEYRIGSPDADEYVRIGEGFETDFASVPRALWWLWPPNGGLYTPAVLVHDCLYKTGHVSVADGSVRWITRKEADDICREGMDVLGCNWITRNGIYRGVRIGGGPAWNRHRKAQGHEVEAHR